MELYEEGIPKNIRYMIERGVHSIVPAAGTGEIMVALVCGKNHPAKTLHLWFMIGAKGYTCGLINFIPKLEVEIYKAAAKGDYKKCVELQGKIAPLSLFREKTKGNMVKEAMNMIGLAGGSIRPPQLPMPEEEKIELKNLLKEYGFNMEG